MIRLLLTSLFFLAGWIGSALGDEHKLGIIAKLSPADLTPEITKTLAEIGPATTVEVAPGERLGAIVARHCGRDDGNFLELLKQRPAALSIPEAAITGDYVFAVKRTLELPYCLKFPDSAPPVSESPGSTGAPTLQCSSSQECFSNRHGYVPANSTISDSWVMPTGIGHPGWAGELGVPVAATEASPLRSYVAVPLRKGVSAEEAASSLNRPSAAGSRFRKEEGGIQQITVLSASEDNCKPLSETQVTEKYPVDVYAVLRVLGLNQSVRSGRGPAPLPIVVGDSGLYFDLNAGVFFPEQIDLNNLSARNPNPTYKYSEHGTYVASAALGGPYFMRFWPLLERPVQLRAQNIISKERGCLAIAGSSPKTQDHCEIEDELLSNLMSSGNSSAIVNLSVQRLGRIEGLETELLRSSAQYLVVAAAGNDSGQIAAGSHPAELASDSTMGESILVVAALDTDGKALAPFSSYHPTWVELAAPGCRVPVYEYVNSSANDPSHYQVTSQSGTSIAAPLVTFTAALLREQFEMSPRLLKRRLLVSADYDPELKGDVKNNAKLNIPRALAVFHDVVELQSGRVIYGKLEGGDFSLALCGGRRPQSRNELGSLSVYMTPSTGANGTTRVFFYYGEGGRLDQTFKPLATDDCELSEPNADNQGVDLADRKLAIDDAETGQKVIFPLGEVANITFAFKPYWQN